MSKFLPLIDTLNRDRKYLDKFYLGKVVDNNDPKQIGRLKVEIPGIYEGGAELLPWVYKKESGTSDMGGVAIPEVGSIVEVYFPDHDLYAAVYNGYYENEKTIQQKQDLLEDYPNTYGFIDSKGNKFIVNKTQGTVKFIHHSGSSIIFEDNGNYCVESVGDICGLADGEFTSYGKAGSNYGYATSTTTVLGQTVALARNGGLPVAVLGCQSIGTGNQGQPVISILVEGSSVVTAPKS